MDLKPKNLFKRVIDFARGERVRPARDVATDDVATDDVATDGVATDGVATEAGRRSAFKAASVHIPIENVPPDLGDCGDVRGLEVARRSDGSGLLLRWAISEGDVSRAGALVDGQPVLCLRVVSFTKVRDDVLREVQDRPGVELVGECEIGEPSQRAIVALGVRVGDRFVSIAHHVV